MVQMTSKKWAIILFISIALNIFLGSVLVADKFFKEKRHAFRGMVYSVPWAVKVIGKEVREQMMAAEGRLPDALVAAVGGGSNAIGLFHPFLDDPDVKIYGVEAGGRGLVDGQGAPSSAREFVGDGGADHPSSDDDGVVAIVGHGASLPDRIPAFRPT